MAPHLEQSPFKLTFFYPQHLYPDVLQRLQQLLQMAGVAPVVVEGGAGECWGLCWQVLLAGVAPLAAARPHAVISNPVGQDSSLTCCYSCHATC